MSARKTVIDAIVSGLKESTGINYASQKMEAWWEWKPTRFPGVTVIDGDTSVDRLGYPDSTVDDMLAEVDFEIRGYVFDKGNNLDTKRTNLLMDIEKTIKGSTLITAQAEDVQIDSIETDKGQIENYAVCAVNATVLYFYNHLSP